VESFLDTANNLYKRAKDCHVNEIKRNSYLQAAKNIEAIADILQQTFSR
jgi:hypothetical protein